MTTMVASPLSANPTKTLRRGVEFRPITLRWNKPQFFTIASAIDLNWNGVIAAYRRNHRWIDVAYNPAARCLRYIRYGEGARTTFRSLKKGQEGDWKTMIRLIEQDLHAISK